MSMIKPFAEEISVEMGLDGELTDEVLIAAENRLAALAECFCPACGSESLSLLGMLGNHAHLRCCHCGMDSACTIESH